MSAHSPTARSVLAQTLRALADAIETLESAEPRGDEMLSQRTVFVATGITPRLYLETLRRTDFLLPIARLGKLRLVERSAFVAWLKSQATASAAPPLTQEATPLDDVVRAMLRAGGRLATPEEKTLAKRDSVLFALEMAALKIKRRTTQKAARQR